MTKYFREDRLANCRDQSVARAQIESIMETTNGKLYFEQGGFTEGPGFFGKSVVNLLRLANPNFLTPLLPIF